MTIERKIRAFAGTIVLGSVALAHYHNPHWIYLTAFAGFNLLQSAFTGFCLPEIILKKLQKDEEGCCGECPKK